MNFLSRCAKSVGAMRSRGPRGLRFLFQDCGDDHSSGTMAEITEKIKEQVGVEMGYHTIPKCRAGLLKYHPKLEDLPERSMKDSYRTAVLPLGSDVKVRERHVNYLGMVRGGRLIEEMDMLAIWICHCHVKLPSLPRNTPLPYTFVTLLVDSVELLVQAKADIDLMLSGHVSWTGTSSMEISINVRQQEQSIAKGIFLMVARNATNTGPAPVNPLKPTMEQEKIYWEAAKERKKKKTTPSTCLDKTPLTEPEQKLMYELFMRTRGTDILWERSNVEKPDFSWISSTQRSTVLLPFPENRNNHNTIYGGYIMRNAVEICYITASFYAGRRPVWQYLSDVAFFQPVHVTSILKLTAYVVYTSDKHMQLMAVANVLDANSFSEVQTNAFHLTYLSEHKVKEVLPHSYQETVWHIIGRRHFQAFQNRK
ncbi:acyl-coenzyme A thioesterase 9, mitochondrial-like isoform X1 [Drosophila pseudoobscura]|uniref:Acyl-coenzyme A thioesterase 9, mitochondrial-like isoform X1 n=2 Tax=Drosophila pseudoobscura pseudoobscura TaxID=46245 RepID=A0A6I8UYF2_DROPS|nr:acyl-coenzyme A thioesterase 9, mitochondrial isoform X1 [Drosophila pseudoobscura]